MLMRCRKYLLALKLLLANTESILQQLRLLLNVVLLSTSRNRRRRVTSRIHDMLAVVVLSLVEHSLNTWLRESPSTSIEWLLLCPDNSLGVWIGVEVVLDLLPWEWVKLLDTSDGGVGDVVVGAVLEESGVDLSGTEDDALDLLLLLDGLAVLGILNYPAEVGVTSELLDGRAGNGVTEKSLREKDDECYIVLVMVRYRKGRIKLTLAELSVHLSAQNVEQVRWRGHVSDLHVAVLVLALELLRSWEDTWVLRGQLKITLHAARGVLWSLSIISVWKGHNKTGTLHPLNLTGSDELINDTLSVVGEVTELGLPHDEGVWGGERVTVLESKDTELREGRVGDDKLALVLGDVLEWSPGLLGLLVVENSVTLGEGTTLNILTGDTDVVTLADKSTEGQSLSSGPVNVLALSDRLGSGTENTLQVAVDAEVIWGGANGNTDVLQSLLVDTGWWMGKDLRSKLLGRLESVPGRGGPLLRGWSVVLGLGEGLLEHTPNPLLVLINILLGKGAVLQELVGVDIDLWLVGLNALVHQWLGERWLISLVVAVLSVADQVDNDIRAELRAPIGSKLADKVNSLNIISVNVEHWGVNGLGDIGAVGGRASKTWVSGETDLVVHDDVDSSAGRVGWKSVETEALVDDTLGGESSISVEKDAHGGVVALLVVVVVLDGAGLSKNDWVLGLQMRWVSNQRKLDTLAGWSWALEVHSQMVLDVSGTLILSGDRAGELGEDRLVWLADNVGQNVKTSTMWHTDDNILDTIVDGAINESLHSWNKGLATFKTETLVVRVLGGREGLEGGRPDKSVENATLLISGVLVWLWNLNALSEPIATLAIWDVDVLDTVGAAVDRLAGLDDLAESHLITSLLLESWEDAWAERVLGVEILLGEAVVLELQLLWVGVAELLCLRADAERIDVGLVVTTGLVCADQKLDLQVVGNVVALSSGHSWSWHERWNTALGGWDQGWWWGEGLGHWHVTALHVLEVCSPGDMDALWVLLPGHVHLVDVVRRVTRQEAVIWVWRVGGGIALLETDS